MRKDWPNPLQKFHIWGLYAVYSMCVILVLQSLSIASSFSTIHVWLQASFPLQISVLSQDLPKTVQNDNFWKGEMNQKSAPSKFHIWGLYAVYGMCAILVLQSLSIASSFSTIHVWLQASFPLQISVLSQDLPKTVQNDNFWKGEMNQKSAPSKFHIWGLYAVYSMCAILVLQSLGIGSSFSTIHVGLQASFPNFGSEPRFAKNCPKWQFLKRRIEPKKRTFQIPHLGSICSIRYVCHLSVAEFGHSLLIFNDLFGRTGIFPFWILGGYEPRLAQDLKRRIEPQKTNLPNPPSWGLYAIYGLCAISCHHPFPEVCIPMSVIRCMSAAFCTSKNTLYHVIFQAFGLITGTNIANHMGSTITVKY